MEKAIDIVIWKRESSFEINKLFDIKEDSGRLK